MIEGNIIYSLKEKSLIKIEDYLGKNSEEYAFSAKKGEEKNILFIDKNKRVFAILNQDKKELELAEYVNPEIINGIEKIIDFGGRR